jgi:hypothetical protein
MAVPVPGVAEPIRHHDVIENYRELQKTNPLFTFEYGLKAMLNTFTLHDFALFHVLEEEYGTEKAVNLRQDLEEAHRPRAPGLKEMVGWGRTIR